MECLTRLRLVPAAVHHSNTPLLQHSMAGRAMLIPIPYATDRELRRFPIVTLFLVGLNCAVFLLSVWSGLEVIV